MSNRLPFPAAQRRSRPDRPPPPPAHLEEAGRELWGGVMAVYALDETHHKALLQAACEARDRLAQARALVDAEGITVDGGRYGAKAHPALAVERDARIAMARCLREIGLDLVADPARPPSRWS